MDKVKCLNCHNFSFRDSMKRMVKFSETGMGNCSHDHASTYYNSQFERICQKFDKAEKATIDKRILFLTTLGINGNDTTT